MHDQTGTNSLTLRNVKENFHAGKLASCLPVWRSLTSDKWILDAIAGCQIEFVEDPDFGGLPMVNSNSQSPIMNNLLSEFQKKGIIERSHSAGGFFSNVFLVEKRDLSHRVILNLKNLNEFVAQHHFKMDTLKDALCLVTQNCFFGSVDLTDAYFSILVHPEYRKFLKFVWKGEVFQFTCLPQGLSSAPRIFTKVLKPVFASLRKHGHQIIGYIDDSLVVSNTAEELMSSVQTAANLFDSLGFTINLQKSVLRPTQQIEYLGFILDSCNMTVSLSERKKQKIKSLCQSVKMHPTCTVRDYAQLIGNLVAAVPGVDMAPLYIKRLEIEKALFLKQNKGDFDSVITVSSKALEDIDWWIENIESAEKPIFRTEHSLVIQSDASNKGWGGVLLDQSREQISSSGGRWAMSEAREHINYLGLLACFMALKSFLPNSQNVHCLVELDNTTAVACLNNMGSTKVKLYDLTREIWIWCSQRKIWLTATHLPGVQNQLADRESRVFNDDTEWALDLDVFESIENQYGILDIDLFASRLNHKIEPYVSWRPDPNAKAINAFTLNWGQFCAYMFPPFSVLGAVLQKIRKDEATAVLIFPVWPTRPWFSTLLGLLIRQPNLLPRHCLHLPHDQKKSHPLKEKLVLAVGMFSGSCLRTRLIRNSCQTTLQLVERFHEKTVLDTYQKLDVFLFRKTS